MNLEMIRAEYREEMTGTFRLLRDEMLAGRLNSKQFLAAQRRIYEAFAIASR